MELVKYKNALTLPGATKTSLSLSDDITFDEWQDVGQRIMSCAHSCMWWLGDWWAFGDHKYGERAAQAVDSDISYETFKAAGKVSARIEKGSRLPLLSWGHHQAVAFLEPEDRDKLLDKAEKEGLSRRELRKAVRDLKVIKRDTEPLPDGKYRVIYADPPWKYNDELNLDGYDGIAASSNYPTMSLDEICALPVSDLAADNCVLFLWATAPMLEDAITVPKAWGFKYKTHIVWDKVKPCGIGHYHTTNHELLLIATRGSCLPNGEKFDSVQSIEKQKRHSEKPEHFREIIDAMYQNSPRIELFRRGNVPDGWTVWGNEADAA